MSFELTPLEIFKTSNTIFKVKKLAWIRFKEKKYILYIKLSLLYHPYLVCVNIFPMFSQKYFASNWNISDALLNFTEMTFKIIVVELLHEIRI